MSAWETPGASDEWYTPAFVFEALGVRFDLDVAHPRDTRTNVPACAYFWERGLENDWFGLVWMNPPFGGRNGLVPWLEKFFEHGNGIALTPDRTSAPWFQSAWSRADAVLFTPKIQFLRPDGTKGTSPSNGTALWGVGPEAVQALERAAAIGLGVLAQPRSIPSRTTSTSPDDQQAVAG